MHTLDLSHQHTDLATLVSHAHNLHTLVLDHNQLYDIQLLPNLPLLHTLSLNNNNLHDFNQTLACIANNCPNIKALALMRNPICPDPYFADHAHTAELLYHKYRVQVLRALPALVFIDASPVTPAERREARKPVEDKGETGEGQHEIPQARAKKQGAIITKARVRYDGNNSEGNRFIKNKDL